ncbi:hypothetical protein [Paenibacillus spongiae]|uniref:Uncharacterized protein n=1 Tax=Paenibacillus spongiae TaxID=2909671 RepID=A0ABY5S7C5_9BACL|nr:hypothetical protein [Paenibacillus spongiae]UVI29614.1 hypothetical protein L1F29_30065 [Paenibacillus spongiae]
MPARIPLRPAGGTCGGYSVRLSALPCGLAAAGSVRGSRQQGCWTSLQAMGAIAAGQALHTWDSRPTRGFRLWSGKG